MPGPTTNVSQVDMRFSYADAFGKTSANGYERLLFDAMLEMPRCLRIETVLKQPGPSFRCCSKRGPRTRTPTSPTTRQDRGVPKQPKDCFREMVATGARSSRSQVAAFRTRNSHVLRRWKAIRDSDELVQ